MQKIAVVYARPCILLWINQINPHEIPEEKGLLPQLRSGRVLARDSAGVDDSASFEAVGERGLYGDTKRDSQEGRVRNSDHSNPARRRILCQRRFRRVQRSRSGQQQAITRDPLALRGVTPSETSSTRGVKATSSRGARGAAEPAAEGAAECPRGCERSVHSRAVRTRVHS